MSMAELRTSSDLWDELLHTDGEPRNAAAELVQQLRGQADKRQVEGARIALQHNLGLGGACVVTLYERMSA